MTVTVDQIKREAEILNTKVMIAQASGIISNQFNILNDAMRRLHELLPDEHICAWSASYSTPEYPPVDYSAAAAPASAPVLS